MEISRRTQLRFGWDESVEPTGYSWVSGTITRDRWNRYWRYPAIGWVVLGATFIVVGLADGVLSLVGS